LGRISIGLFNAAPQPLHAQGGACCLWFCGELYHQDARRAALVHEGLLQEGADDAALALALFQREGAAGLAQLDGAFTVAVYERDLDLLTLVNDRYGLYPHYFYQAGTTFAFAPEIKGVLAAPAIPRRLDLTAVAEYARLQQLLGNRTWLEDVHLLPPATILRYSPRSGRLEQTQYWDWDAIQPAPAITFAEAAAETGRLFQRAVDEMIKPPLRAGVYLSGGLDGRTILGFIPPEVPVTAITYGQAGCRDVVYGRALAQRAGRPHRWFDFADGHWVREQSNLHLALTEGMHGWMHAHGMTTLDVASTLIDVNLSGWDGGTTLGGRIDEYATDGALRHPPNEAARTERLYDAFCHTYTWPGLTEAEAEALFSLPGRSDLLHRARASFATAVAATEHYPQPYRLDFFYLAQHVRRSTQSMIVFQRAMMEVRCPYFDYALIDFLYGLPEAILAGPQLHRTVLTQRAPALARIPNEKDDLLPHSSRLVRGSHAALQRARRGARRVAGHLGLPSPTTRTRLYADYEHYLRTDLRPWAQEILFDERTIARGLFAPDAVRSLWERHQSGAELWTIGKIAPLITIELVLRSLLDEPQPVNAHFAGAVPSSVR
jgi:asparagine synthase (glutamine-hydrolysing)